MHQCTDKRGNCGCAHDGTCYTALSGGKTVTVEVCHGARVVESGLVEAVIVVPTAVTQIPPASIMEMTYPSMVAFHPPVTVPAVTMHHAVPVAMMLLAMRLMPGFIMVSTTVHIIMRVMPGGVITVIPVAMSRLVVTSHCEGIAWSFVSVMATLTMVASALSHHVI